MANDGDAETHRGRHRGRGMSRLADSVLGGMDLDALLGGLDVDALVRRIDIDDVVRRIDIDALVRRIDMDDVVARIDINALLDRVDVDRLAGRLDVDTLLERVDVPALVERAGIPELVAESTGHMAGSALDVGRRQLVGVDEVVGRVAYRLTGRDPRRRPQAPVGLAGDLDRVEDGRAVRTGCYAGPVTRTISLGIDTAVVFGVFTVASAGITYVARLFGLGLDISPGTNLWGALLFLTWAYLYFAIAFGLVGRTVGKGLVGLRVVQRDGSPLHGRRALLRPLGYALSVPLLGLSFLGALVSAERRTLGDVLASSTVVYDWGDRPADLPAPLTGWVQRRAEALP